MEISIKRLREYIENDKEYQQFKTVPEETLHKYARLHYIRCWDIENVLNENQQLKDKINSILCDSNRLVNSNEKLGTIIDKYKSVLDEIREYIKYNATSNYFDADTNMFRREVDILQILDKANPSE